MVFRDLERNLTGYGYVKSKAGTADVADYKKKANGDWYLICLMCDDGKNLLYGKLQKILREEAEALYRQGTGRRIYVLGLVLTDNPGQSRRNCAGTFPCWYIEEKQNRLIIYEDQPGDFLDLRPIIEQTLSERSGGKTIRKRKKRTGAFRLTPVNTAIVLINVFTFIYLEVIGDTTDAWFMYEHGAMLIQYMVEDGEWYRLLTCTFLHFGFSHLFNNMIVLLYLGDNLEHVLGSFKYLVLYLTCAVGSSVFSCIWYLMSDSSFVVSAGASGAIFGVVGALLYIVIRNHGRLEDIGSTQLVLLVVFTLYHGITSIAGSVNNSAHVGGLIVGIVMAMILYRKRRNKRQYG